MTRRWFRRATLGAGAAAWLLAAGIATAADRTVEMSDFAFSPQTVTIRAGDRVTWQNTGQAPHDAVGDDWGTDLIVSGEQDSVRFTKAGRYDYICTIHPQMTGTVVVRAAGGGGGGDGGGGAPTPTQPPTDAIAPVEAPVPAFPADLAAVLGLAGLGGLLLATRRLAARRA